jgi:hypothetical protein
VAKHRIFDKAGQPTKYFWSDKHSTSRKRAPVFKETVEGTKKMKGVYFNADEQRIITRARPNRHPSGSIFLVSLYRAIRPVRAQLPIENSTPVPTKEIRSLTRPGMGGATQDVLRVSAVSAVSLSFPDPPSRLRQT